MPVVNPGIRRLLASAIQRLFNGASFSAPLTHSAIPTRAASGTTATFTRATTKTWPNNDGYLVTGVSGEIGFVGARRVDNLIRLGAAQSSTLAVAANVTMTLPAGAYQFSMGAGTGRVTFSGTGGATGTLDAVTTGRVHVAKTITAGTLIVTASVATLVDIQVVSMVAETDQTTIREYVSVGVPSDWAGDELATNGTFDTDTTGWTLSNATAAVSSGEVTLTNTAAAYGTLRQAITTVVGTKYILSGTARVGSATIAYVQAGTYAGAGDLLALTTSSSSNTFLTGTFTATGTTTYLSVAPDATSGHTAIFDNISVKPAYYHGSMVDGVKCFATDINGAAIPSTTLLGYLAEGARTNLCLQSNALTTTWTDSGASPVQNVVGPDGANSAWTLTDNSAVASEQINQSITLTAATHTFSVFVKKTAGAQAAYPALSVYNAGVAQTAACTIDTTNGVATVWTAYTGLTIATSSAICSSYNADFWRVELTFLSTAAAWSVFLNPAVTTNATQSTGTFDVTAQGSAVFYGAQVELGSFASSPIATTTAAVTRNADVLTYSSAGNISGTVGWAYAETSNPNRAGSGAVISTYNSTGATGGMPINFGANYVGIFDNGGYRVGTTPVPALGTVGDKVATTWNGTSGATARLGAVTSVVGLDGDLNINTAIAIGNWASGSGGELFGTVRNVRIGQRQLSASELQAITA